MRFEDLMKDLGADENVLSDMERHSLDEQGYLLMTDLIDRVWLDQLREAFEKADSNQSYYSTAISGTAERGIIAGVPAGLCKVCFGLAKLFLHMPSHYMTGRMIFR